MREMKSVTQSQGGEEYPAYCKMKEGDLDRSHVNRNGLLEHDIEGEIEGRRERRRQRLLDEFKEARAVFLNRRAAARYRALASIIPGRERFSWNLSF